MSTRQSAADRVGSSSSFGRAALARSTRGQLIAAATGEDAEEAVSEVSLDRISPNPDNPRDSLGDIDGLASSLAEIGLVQAITIANVDAYLRDRPGRQHELAAGARYVVVDGHRRLAAAHAAGLESIRVTVNDDLTATDEKLLEAAFVANAQRENLTDLEEAQALSQLVALYGSQHKAAKRLGVSQPYISQRLSLLSLAPDLQADLEAGRRKVEHVRGLAKLTPDEQRAAANERAEAAGTQPRRRSSVPPQAAAPTESTDNAVITEASAPAPHTSHASGSVGTSPGSGSVERGTPVSDSAEAPAAPESADNGVISKGEGDAHLVDIRRIPRVPWHDGQAVAELVLEKMDSAQRAVLIEKLIEAHGDK
ncbi:ParB/RepB/Spo0J family partition protein [Streptomyces sp. IBSNAI002]|uniref:ParB/RepB/Spo0J family partition protein n=1 Tax=Streptomyces sp. IBSNAI002 TaxID=3457500 RepID=UPI003FD2E1C8